MSSRCHTMLTRVHCSAHVEPVPHYANERPPTAQSTSSKIKSETLRKLFISSNCHIGEKITTNYVCVRLTDVTVCWNTELQYLFGYGFAELTLSGVRSLAVWHRLPGVRTHQLWQEIELKRSKILIYKTWRITMSNFKRALNYGYNI